MASLRSIRSRLEKYDHYVDPFPDDIESSFADLLDALDSEQQHKKVAALSVLFRKGLASATSALDQVDYGHRVLLFLMKTRGRVIDSQIDEDFMRAFMRAVGSKKRREAELEQENERVRRLLADQDEASEDGRWWRREVCFSSGDELSDWSDTDTDTDFDSMIDSRDDDGDREDGERGGHAQESTSASTSMISGGDQGPETNIGNHEIHPLPRPNENHGMSLPLLRDRSARIRNMDVQRRAQHGGTPYSDPRSLAVWMAVKSNPESTHLSECLNPRQCLSKGSFVEQMLNAIMGLERPGPMIRADASYELIDGVHLEEISVNATRTVAHRVLEVANALRRSHLGLQRLPRAMASAVAREIQLCRQHCLEERPRSLTDLVRACCSVRHRSMILDAAVKMMIDPGTDAAESVIDGKRLTSATDVIRAMVDEIELTCSSGATITGMGVLLALLVASEGVPNAFRADARRLCREYMAAAVIGTKASLESPQELQIPLILIGRPKEARRMEWWDEEYDDMAQDVPLSRFTGSSPSLQRRVWDTPMIVTGDSNQVYEVEKKDESDDSDEQAVQDVLVDPFFHADPRRHFRMMEDSSRTALDTYWSGSPFGEYESLAAVQASVLKKIDEMFGKAVPASPVTPSTPVVKPVHPSAGDFKALLTPRDDTRAIYPLSPPLQLMAMSHGSAPQLVTAQLEQLADQIASVKRICFMPLQFDDMEDDLRASVESMWTTGDGSQTIHHVAFQAPLSNMLGPEARRGLSIARGAVLSLQTDWKTAVDGRRESLKRTCARGAPSSGSRAGHLQDLAAIIDHREAARAVELAFWDFEGTVSSVMYEGSDVSHLSEVVNRSMVELGHAVKKLVWWPRATLVE